MANMITRIYNGFVYLTQDVIWRFQSTSPREYQAYCHLRRYTSPVLANLSLDREADPINGMLPHALGAHPVLADRITSDAIRLSHSSSDPLSKILSHDEKVEYLRLITIPDALRRQFG